jgi:hypothetical protein
VLAGLELVVATKIQILSISIASIITSKTRYES